MTSIAERLEAVHEKSKQAYARYQKAKDEVDQLTADSVRLQLIQFAERVPEITFFELDANFEYDDEGGYYYSATLRGQTGEEGDTQDWEPPEDSVLSEDDLYDVSHDLDEASAAIIFGGESLEGLISVVQLRAEVGV